MADAESKKFRSKRIRLSPEREIEGLSPPKASKSDKEGAIVDEEPILSNFSVFQETSCSSREHDGGNNEFSKHEQFDGDDFPSCFSVEDDIDNIEERHYQPIAGPMGWVQRQMTLGINPREILSYMIPHAKVPTEIEDSHSTLWKIIISLLTSPTPRQKLDYVNTLDDVVSLVNSCKNIVVLTGAGEIYPGQFKPSLSHRFIRQIEEHGRLLRNYSQNIDTLEQIAGITRVIQCH
ncbi:NAD-dependent protein deacetylase sirtuin-1-like, partial [Actinia tenebrosa]|uniref:NAD-dependent protein deacetylase sirtuin-1-like n=1 Tax=Actinia tenebrosa TaxID=6105 RepID=A0A6P8HKS2_ACTTE